MERYAGSLLPAVKSRRNPNAALAQRSKRVAQLEHIKNKYQLHDLFRFHARHPELSSKEIVYPECLSISHSTPRISNTSFLDPQDVLRYPRQLKFEPDSNLRHKIAVYLRTCFLIKGSDWPTLAHVKERMPVVMPKWCKVRIKDGSQGECIRGSAASFNTDKERDSSYVRVSTDTTYCGSMLRKTDSYIDFQFSQLVDIHASQANAPSVFEQQIYYGQLHFVLVCNMPRSNVLRLPADKRFLLAYITPCDTSRLENRRKVWPDGSKELVTYTQDQSPLIVDLAAVECVVGRVRFGIVTPKWGIIDRSGEGARTTFTDGDEWNDDDEM